MRLLRWLGWLAGLAVLAVAGPAEAAEDVVEARVTYVTGSSVYLDAGREEGLRVGDRLEVIRESAVVAVLEVTYLASHRASCSIEESSAAPRAGDLARLVLASRPPALVVPVAPDHRDEATVRPSAPRRGGGRLHGRVGVRYLKVDDASGRDGGFDQPAMDLRLDGHDLGGAPVDLAVDVRARRTSRDGSDAGDHHTQTRVYRMAVGWTPARAGTEIVVGRQFAADLAAVSIFDGVLVRYARSRWAAGGFSGFQPEPGDLDHSTDIQEHGGFFELRSRRGAARRWSLTTGLIGSYQDGEVNREFLYLQGRLSARRLSAYFAQEVDYNRDWKQEVESDTFNATSTFASVSYRAGSVVTLRAGFDDRRNVRLYRDRTTPETDFDDAYRQGAWAGASFRWAGRWRGSVDYRTRSGGTAGDADSYTVTFGVRDLTAWDLGFGARSTRYENDTTEGWLHSVSFDLSPQARTHLSLNAGVRTEQSPIYDDLDETIPWFGLDIDVTLARRWYLLLSAEHTAGDLEDYTEYYTSLSYRF